MAYADYDFYASEYQGTMTEADFGRCSERASDYINSRTNYTFCTAEITDTQLADRVKRCCCALADIINSNNSGGVKTAESVGDYSVSYAVTEKLSYPKQLDDVIQMYLADVVKAVMWI